MPPTTFSASLRNGPAIWLVKSALMLQKAISYDSRGNIHLLVHASVCDEYS